MSGVSFDEEPSYIPRHHSAVATAEQGSIMNLMFKLGIAKTQKDATVILSSIIVVCLILSGTMLVFFQPHAHPMSKDRLDSDLARMRATTISATPPTQ